MKIIFIFTLTSLKLNASAVNVVFTTDGLFLTLGNIIPPFLDKGFGVVVDGNVGWLVVVVVVCIPTTYDCVVVGC